MNSRGIFKRVLRWFGIAVGGLRRATQPQVILPPEPNGVRFKA